jgi:hypothetical protein
MSATNNKLPAIVFPIVLVVSIVCYAIAFWHTAMGLSSYEIMNFKYGGFLVAFILTACMGLFIYLAARGRILFIFGYLITATICFICNFNAFYPHDMADKLIREELKQQQDDMVALSVAIEKNYSEPMKHIKDVEAKMEELHQQLKQYGFGEQARKVLAEIGNLLRTTISELPVSASDNNKDTWEKLYASYDEIVKKHLAAYLENQKFVDSVATLKGQRHQEIARLLGSKEPMCDFNKRPVCDLPEAGQKFVNEYRAACLVLKKNGGSDCNENYPLVNVEIGKFTHTWASAQKHFGEASVIGVFVLCLFIDFLVPIMLFFVLKEESGTGSSSSGRWFRKGPTPMNVQRN